MNLPDPATPSPDVREVRYEYTPNLPEILKNLKASLLVTTYQAGKLLVLGEHDNRLQISFCNFEQAMGVAVSPQTIAVGSRRQIHFLVAAHECAPTIAPQGVYDSCFVPRSTHCTGSIQGHDLAWGSEGLWIVNTLFSCLCTLHDGYNFVPRWRPKFITQLIDQDRCHLNGLAMEHGRPRYVTVLAESDEPAGWRARKESTGAVIEVDSQEVVARGFAMPHSPRLHLGQLWLLDSGTGRVGIVDRGSGQFSEVELVPGYPRGLALHGQFAFVGLSKIRETAVFCGLPITQKFNELRCGIAVIDLNSERTVSVFQFHSGVDEIYGVELLAGMRNPMVASSAVDMHERDVWIVPDPKMPAPQVAPGLPV